MSNATLRAKLESAIDIILSAPDHLRTTFTSAPLTTQPLQASTPSGSPAAQRTLSLASSLTTTVESGSASQPNATRPLNLPAITAVLSQLASHLAALAPGSSHPVTRRVVLAALTRLQLRLYTTPFPSSNTTTATTTSATAGSGNVATPLAPISTTAAAADLDSALLRIYWTLFNVHRRGAAAKSSIEFLHISKSGGTSMCAVADRNGCAAESTTNFGNCMVRRFDDRPRWVSAAVHNESGPLPGWRWYYRYLVRRGERSCEYRDEFMLRRGFTFYSNEFAAHGGLDPGWLPLPTNGTIDTTSRLGNSSSSSSGRDGGDLMVDGDRGSSAPWSSTHLCPHFLNVVILRDPMHRLLSHIRWILKVYRTEYGKQYEHFFRGRDAAYWRRFAPAAVDNYYIRLLLGEAVFYLPSGAINATHLAAARLLLLQYDVVMLLEAHDIDSLWLKQALGWRAGLAGSRARVTAARRPLEEHLPSNLDDLMAANGADTELYDFGAVLHQLDGLMYATVVADGGMPYEGYDSLDPRDEETLGQRVRCGYVTRRDELLAAAVVAPAGVASAGAGTVAAAGADGAGASGTNGDSGSGISPGGLGLPGFNLTALQRRYAVEFPKIAALDEQPDGSPLLTSDARDQQRKAHKAKTKAQLKAKQKANARQQQQQQQELKQQRAKVLNPSRNSGSRGVAVGGGRAEVSSRSGSSG